MLPLCVNIAKSWGFCRDVLEFESSRARPIILFGSVYLRTGSHPCVGCTKKLSRPHAGRCNNVQRSIWRELEVENVRGHCWDNPRPWKAVQMSEVLRLRAADLL